MTGRFSTLAKRLGVHRSVPLAALALVSAGAMSAHATAQSPLEAAGLQAFTGTEAKSLGDFSGRALLLEFFAHW